MIFIYMILNSVFKKLDIGSWEHTKKKDYSLHKYICSVHNKQLNLEV